MARAAAGYFVEACLALLDIVDRKLYKEAGYHTFDQYVNSTTALGFGRRRAYAWVAAARVIRLLPNGLPRPINERQVRPLVSCDRTVAVQAWSLALSRASEAGDRHASGALVAKCVAEVQGSAGSDRPAAPEDHSARSGGVEAVADAADATVETSSSDGDEGSAGDAAMRVFKLSGSCEWYTPSHVLELVRELFAPGVIDLDPCSSAEANTRVGATAYYDAAADGLSEDNAWEGNVFVNPPFGKIRGRSMQGAFFKRCAREYEAGSVKQAVLLLRAGVGYGWFADVMRYPFCFVTRRLAFVRQAQTAGELQWESQVQNPAGSVVVYMGPNAAQFAELFSRIGSVPGMNAWAHVGE